MKHIVVAAMNAINSLVAEVVSGVSCNQCSNLGVCCVLLFELISDFLKIVNVY